MIRFANWEMRGELIKIWEVCLGKSLRQARYFFNNCFSPQNCIVYQKHDEIVAVVYMLPARIATGESTAQAHYIYAGSTLPKYRGRGYMATLLATVALVGVNRGDQYSIVLPEDLGLYEFYQKCDYTPFFQISTQSVSLEQMCEISESGVSNKVILTYRQLNVLRNSKLGIGSVLWSDEAFCFADGIGKVCGDKLICSKTGAKPAYAVCRRADEETCNVMELMADCDTISDLAANIICTLPAQIYIFRLPIGSTLLGQKGENSKFGMIKPIGGSVLIPFLKASNAPYLGLSLD